MSSFVFERKQTRLLSERLQEPRALIQVVAGPRQVGKTTLTTQALGHLKAPSIYVSADDAALSGSTWLESQWRRARLLLASEPTEMGAVLVIDEIQKIPNWSETVKHLWDEDTIQKRPLKVVILGSSALLLQEGLSESLMGRFEQIPVMHWTYYEMQQAFGWSLNQFIAYGGYPGSAWLIADPIRWSHYINDSLIESTLSKDILMTTRILKPSLLRHLLHLGCEYSGQILSYQKVLGQIQEKGNVHTLIHYLQLLQRAGLLQGIEKYASALIRQKASSPKFQIMNNALMTAQKRLPLELIQKNPELWGRWVESAVGGHLVNHARDIQGKVFYWREGNLEVDFVLQTPQDLIAIEVKSSFHRDAFPGLDAFSKQFGGKRILLGEGGASIEQFLTIPLNDWINSL